MKRTFCTFVLLLTFGVLLAQSKADFTGGYAIDTSRTQFGEAPKWVLPVRLKLVKEGNKITMIRTIADEPGKESDRILAFGTDTTFEYSSPSGAKNTATLRWNADHSVMTLNQQSVTADGKPGAAFREVWSLADNGKTLVVDRHTEQANGLKYDIRAYYTRQSQ